MPAAPLLRRARTGEQASAWSWTRCQERAEVTTGAGSAAAGTAERGSATGSGVHDRRGPGRDLGPPGHPELGQDVLDVRARGLGGDVELLGDLGVREAARDQARHLEFAGGQRPPRLLDAAASAPDPGQLVGARDERRAAETLGRLADRGQPGGRLAEPVRSHQALGEVEASPGGLPDPPDVRPAAFGLFQGVACRGQRTRGQPQQSLGVGEGRAADGLPTPEVLSQAVEPLGRVHGPVRRQQGPHPRHRERDEERTFAGGRGDIQRALTTFRGARWISGDQVELRQAPERRQEIGDLVHALGGLERLVVPAMSLGQLAPAHRHDAEGIDGADDPAAAAPLDQFLPGDLDGVVPATAGPGDPRGCRRHLLPAVRLLDRVRVPHALADRRLRGPVIENSVGHHREVAECGDADQFVAGVAGFAGRGEPAREAGRDVAGGNVDAGLREGDIERCLRITDGLRKLERERGVRRCRLEHRGIHLEERAGVVDLGKEVVAVEAGCQMLGLVEHLVEPHDLVAIGTPSRPGIRTSERCMFAASSGRPASRYCSRARFAASSAWTLRSIADAESLYAA